MRIPKKRWTALLALLAGLILCGKAAAADGSSFEPMPGVAAASFAPYRLSCTLVNPLPGAELTDGYGWRYHPITGSLDFHYGNDLAAPSGTEIYAAAGGRIPGERARCFMPGNCALRSPLPGRKLCWRRNFRHGAGDHR